MAKLLYETVKRKVKSKDAAVQVKKVKSGEKVKLAGNVCM